MAILVITGELGSGKTLSLTYLCWRNWYYKNRIIYSNYTLYKIPYFKVTRISELDKIRQGYCGFDEIWVWLEASIGERLKRKIVSDILRKSRKRNLTIASTSQTLEQIPSRIRKILDFIGYPILNRNQTICKLLIFSGPKGRSLLRTHYFFTAPVFEMYDTNEEVGDLIDDISRSWKKGISPTTQLKYQEEFLGEKEINNKELWKRNLKLPEIKLNIEQPEISLEEAEDEKVWKEEEKKIKEIEKIIKEKKE